MRLWYIFRKKRRLIFLAIIVILFFSITQSYFDDNVIQFVKIKGLQIYEENVTKVVKESIIDQKDIDLMKLKYDSEGKISYAYLDTYQALEIKAKASELLASLNENIEKKINYVSVPVGYLFTRRFILTNGLKIPLKLCVYQAFDSQITSDVKDYGINNQLYEIALKIKMDIFVQIPFQNQLISYEDSILLSSGIINNEIPNYYFNVS